MQPAIRERIQFCVSYTRGFASRRTVSFRPASVESSHCMCLNSAVSQIFCRSKSERVMRRTTMCFTKPHCTRVFSYQETHRDIKVFFRAVTNTLLSTLACYAAHCPFTHCICLQIKKISINNRKIPRAIILAGAVLRCGFRTQASACRRVGQSIRADPRHIVAQSYNIYRCRQNEVDTFGQSESRAHTSILIGVFEARGGLRTGESSCFDSHRLFVVAGDAII
jgi:hypothetical protein